MIDVLQTQAAQICLIKNIVCQKQNHPDPLKNESKNVSPSFTKEFVNAEGEYHDCSTLVSGSFVGSDPFSDKLMVGSKASVKIYEFDKLYGQIASYKIILN